jgi:hypothetical protein
MAERRIREEDWSEGNFVLANSEEAEKGHIACLDLTSGEVVAGQVDANLRTLGIFTQTLTGDGTLRVGVKLPREVKLHWFKNDGTDAVAASDIGALCYVLDSETVSASHDTNARSAAGRVWGVNATHGVLVELGAA